MISKNIICLLALSSAFSTFANPYPDPQAVPKDADAKINFAPDSPVVSISAGVGGLEVLRIRVDYNRSNKTYTLGEIVKENSGTPALELRSRSVDPHGSFRAELVSLKSGKVLYAGTQGTGYYFRELSRALSFRFPMIAEKVTLRVFAESDSNGAAQKIIEQQISPTDATTTSITDGVEVRSLATSTHERPLTVNFYAEGYTAARKSQFWTDANKALSSLKNSDFPNIERFHVNAVWFASTQALGTSQDLGSDIPERNSFLGLYFPYWANFGRWYNIVYPTRVERYRRALAVHPYDYPIAIVDSAEYWGVGNFNELTAVPARNASFTYLLLHEFGHYFGLNEEYESGGATELAFAPQISEPWSQNITFKNKRADIKWKQFIPNSTPVPTSSGFGGVGVYAGGYAQTPKPGSVYKPVTQCTMGSGGGFCAVCSAALKYRIAFDAGDFAPPVEPDVDDGQDGEACYCAENASGQCGLYKGNELKAWTMLNDSLKCDQDVCNEAFRFHRKIHCRK